MPTFIVQKGAEDVSWHTVYEGKWVDAPSGGDFKLGDFSSITEPGDYRILCGELKGVEKFDMPGWLEEVQSFHFPVRDGVYDVAQRIFLMYITLQRCGSKKGWAGLCHMDPVPVKDAGGRTVRLIDARGGYHQSCDLRNWHDGISMSMYALLRYAELKKPLWDDGEIAAALPQALFQSRHHPRLYGHEGLGSGRDQQRLFRALRIQLRPALPDRIKIQPVPGAHVLLGQRRDELGRSAQRGGGLPAAGERTGENGQVQGSEFCTEQTGLHATERAERRVSPAEAHMCAQREIGVPVPKQINRAHQNRPSKYPSNSSPAFSRRASE